MSKLTLIEVKTQSEDYVVTLQRHDGAKIRILVPNGCPCWPNTAVTNPGAGPFGLNLVSPGHHT